MSLGLVAHGGGPARAHAWSLSVDDATMAWSCGLTAEALDMLSLSALDPDRGDPLAIAPLLDPASPDGETAYPAVSARAVRLLSHVGLEVYPIDGAEAPALVSSFRFDALSGRGAPDDAGWHEEISFSSNCPGCLGDADATLDLLAGFTLPPQPEPDL
jgi:hypothetical protein